MEKKIIGPLVLVLLIVGSMISWGILEMKRQQEEEPSPEQPAEPTPDISPQIDFFADNVDANIHELTALHPIYGFTDETNLVNVAQALQGLESIERIMNWEFLNPVPEKERFMPFTAEIVPSRDSNIESVIEEIEGNNILTELEVYRKAVVKIPQMVTLNSIQADLNISRDANFEEPFAICIVEKDSILGDRLKIRLILSMRGSEVLRETMEALMIQNLSSMPQLRQAVLTEKISRLDSMLGFEETIKYSGFGAEALKLSLEEPDWAGEVELELSKIEGAITININTAGLGDLNALEQDMNSAFSGIAGIKKIFFHEYEEYLETRVTYDKDIGYASIRQEAVSAAESALSGKEYEFIDPRADLRGEISFSDANAAGHAPVARGIFSSYGVDLNLWQQAYFDINSLTDFATGEEFLLPEDQRELPVRVEPGTELGRELLIQAFFQTIRSDVIAVQSTEIQE